MGAPKADLQVGGIPLGEKTAMALAQTGLRVIILGNEPIEPHDFSPDSHPHSGPLAAIAEANPDTDTVFIASCDMPLFDPAIVRVLGEKIEEFEAAVPALHGRLQPLCALYKSSAIDRLAALHAAGETRLMVWLDSIRVRPIPDEEIRAAGLSPESFANANTPEELARILERGTGR